MQMRSYSSNTVLTTDQLRAKAPSIFTEDAYSKTSARYAHISTMDVVNGLQGEGFMPVAAVQCRTRIAGKAAYTKHMLRFRHCDAIANNDGLFPELVLVNSHDGLSSYRLMAGLYRMVCSNGLIAGDTYEQVRVRHQGDIVGNVIEGSYTVMEASQKMLGEADAMRGLILSPDEKRIFAEAVHELKFAGDDTLTKEAIKPLQFLNARRYQENGKDDLFTTFNIAQENVIKGGLRGWARDAKGYAKKVSTRQVKSIDTGNHLNRALWTLAEKMAELKGQAIA